MTDNTEPTEAHTKDACKVLRYDWASYAGNHLNRDEDAAILAVARYIANQQPAIAPELVERMLVIIRRAASHTFGEYVNEARAILAELDASKPDPLVEALQALVCDPVQFAPKVREHLALHGLHITEIQP